MCFGLPPLGNPNVLCNNRLKGERFSGFSIKGHCLKTKDMYMDERMNPGMMGRQSAWWQQQVLCTNLQDPGEIILWSRGETWVCTRDMHWARILTIKTSWVGSECFYLLAGISRQSDMKATLINVTAYCKWWLVWLSMTHLLLSFICC